MRLTEGMKFFATPELKARVEEASSRAEMSVSAWIRMVIKEKLDSMEVKS